MYNNITVYKTSEELALNLSKKFEEKINSKAGKFFLSISGGNTPKTFFKRLAESPFNENVSWNKLDIFWCDERCVPPDDNDSNYGMTKKTLLDFIPLPTENIHRIRGEANTNEEAIRYAKEIEEIVPLSDNNIPRFDWVLLGLGNDGHTASIFPGQNFLFLYSNYCGVATHPSSGQKRISLTFDIINNAREISFIVTGKEKAPILSEIIKKIPKSKSYPAAKVNPVNGTLEWVIDKEAASFL